MVSPSQLPLDLGESPWSRSQRLVAPLFRWAGGKQRFLWENRFRLPAFEGTYFEPFAGGLSIYFHYVRTSPRPFNAVIGDTNLRLIRCYSEVKTDPEAVIDRLHTLVAGYEAALDKEAFYYDVRSSHNSRSPAPDAARFIFLMAAGWNGVFRVNRRGDFNVPHGGVRGLKVPTDEQILAVSTVFQAAELRATSWETTINAAVPGDFIFLDPPYGSESRRDLYLTGENFGLADQERLALQLGELQRRGVDFLLTNSVDPVLVELYEAQNLNIQVISTSRSIAAKSDRRGVEGELIVTPNRDWSVDQNLESDLVLRDLEFKSSRSKE